MAGLWQVTCKSASVEYIMEAVMSAKSYCTLAAAVFALIALLQLTRAVLGWPITVSGHVVPLWASWIAVVVAAVLSAIGWRAAGR
jgi:cytochrome c biogenesis protein CcdA